MASLHKIRTKTSEGWRIGIVLNGSREGIYLGKTNKKAADTIKNRVETIDSCNKAGIPYPADVAQWLGTICDYLYLKRRGIVRIQMTET